MFNLILMNDFASHLIVLSLVLLISTVWYFWFVYRPYAKFPACRLEHRIPYWILKRVPLNYAFFQILIQQARRYESEGVFAAWIGKPILLAYGEEIVKKIVTEPAAIDKPKNYKLFEFAIGQGILTSNGDTWKKQWKMAAPALSKTALKSYTTIMNKHSEEMVQRLFKLNGQPTEEITQILGFCAMGIFDETNLGEKEKNLDEYSHAMMILNKTTDFFVKRVVSPWLHFDFALQLFPSARDARKITSSLLNENLKPRLEIIKESLITRQASAQASALDLELNCKSMKTIGESFIQQHLQDPSISMDEVLIQISILVAGAFHTMIPTLMFAVFLLGTHKDVQKRAFEEVMSETEGHVTNDNLKRLTYLECVIKETLRLYPVPMFGRYLRKELHCGKYKIPRNTEIIVFSYMLHRNPEIYPDPEKFDPERFMDEYSKIKPWNHIPFAEGLRSCIGKNYALNQMKIMLAHVLRNFEIICLNQIEEKDLCWSIVLSCTKKLRMQFLPRKRGYH